MLPIDRERLAGAIERHGGGRTHEYVEPRFGSLQRCKCGFAGERVEVIEHIFEHELGMDTLSAGMAASPLKSGPIGPDDVDKALDGFAINPTVDNGARE